MSPHPEKTEHMLPSGSAPMHKPRSGKFVAFALFVGAALFASRHCMTGSQQPEKSHRVHKSHHSTRDLCPQPPPLSPSSSLAESLDNAIGTVAFHSRAAEWLGGSVRVKTESYDHMGPVGEDDRWIAFAPFHEYLLKAFPQVHQNLKLTKVNTYGLIFEWTGSDASLKPLLLAGHQDVVPVDMTTVDQWTHPPYSGHFDGKRIWGRGSSDDKSGLIGVLSSIEQLLENNFKPTRTIVLAFGFDEEASGKEGAGKLGPALLSVYGKNAFAMIVDEGGKSNVALALVNFSDAPTGFRETHGSVFATPGIAEKGYLDTKVEVTAAGGHSSLPPVHTSIGILAALLVQFEADKTKTHLLRDTPVYGTIQCFAAHAPKLDRKLRKAIKHSVKSNRALRAVEKIMFADRAFESLVGTTHALDLITGGVKVNALPERASAVVNHRIATQQSVAEVKAADTKLLESLASDFNLTFVAFGEQISAAGAPAAGTLTLSDAYGNALEPAPITPTDSPQYQVLAGTIKSTYSAHRGGNLTASDDIKISPGLMSGNTDTRYYWALSKHIYRYNHHNEKSDLIHLGGIHTVDESMGLDAFLEMIRFFTTLILNVDEAKDLN